MKLSEYGKSDLLLAAMKAEKDSNAMYAKMAKKTRNELLAAKLLFLADEEMKHYRHIERMFKKEMPGKRISLPSKTVVPHLAMEPITADLPPSRMFDIAIEAEKAATQFYAALSKLFPVGSDEAFLLAYFSSMERGHQSLFEHERAFLEQARKIDMNVHEV
jgi:rubrerythrin